MAHAASMDHTLEHSTYINDSERLKSYRAIDITEQHVDVLQPQ